MIRTAGEETTNTIHIMKKNYQKTVYTSPEVELLVVRSGESILTVSGLENTIDDAVNDDWGTL